MPTRDAHLQFQKWAQEYGPVFSLILGTKVLVVLSSDVAVKDLLDKRSGLYSHRPDLYIGQTLCSGNLRILMMVSDPSPCCAVHIGDGSTRSAVANAKMKGYTKEWRRVR